ncbi:MAG: RagB/SusD family nutrient uptake outer membrane protein [Tannerellaceae bacterium]|jgi:hypothetical protein|nr:RagB/SusD family nutrient uptake outer membrane protein [Tannerellaceae bacterium]
MKRIVALIQVILLVGIMVVPSSCSDFLEKRPPAAAAGVALETDQGVEALLVGTYAVLRGSGRFGGALATDWTYGSCVADDAYKGSESGDQTNFNLVERFQALPNNPYMTERWQDCYNGVARANQTLIFMKAAQAGGKPLTQTRATQVEAETKFLRAWYHFQANKIFRNIPYIMTPDEMGGKLAEEIPNTGPCWDEIEADLQFAIDNLPESFPGMPGRADKYAAMAVKAHAHMYQNELAEAKNLLDGIIGSGEFSLVNNYFDNFDERTENNSESIFEIQASASAVNKTGLLIQQASAHQTGGAAAVGWGFFQPSQVLVDAFQVDDNGLPILDINARATVKNDNGVLSINEFTPTDQLLDLRLDWTVSRRGIDFLGWGICPGQTWVRTQANGGPYMTKKYMHFAETHAQQNGSGSFNNRNFRMYRLSHILLWRAECAVEEGDLAYARELVNMIRERAKGSTPVMGLCSNTKFEATTVIEVDWSKPAANYKVEPYPAGHAAFASADQARKAVRMEIQLEFATEGHRFFDLRRWGIDVEVLSDYLVRDLQVRDFLKDVVYNEKKRYWPIPQSQLDIQQGVLTQDPNY